VYLLIETSTENGFVALFEGETLIAQKFLPIGLKNSRFLLPELDSLGVDPQKIEWIGVGVGPGSYTGIRVGVVVGKMLAFVWKVPLVGICSLRAYAPSSPGPFSVVFDARISGTYRQKGVKNGGVEWVGPPEIAPLDELTEGPFVTPHSSLSFAEVVQPSPSLFAQEGLKRYNANQWGLEILYLKKTYAEMNFLV
jgi:tRNA threonylcarbamoyladenosine biosynthesis protein TsaB